MNRQQRNRRAAARKRANNPDVDVTEREPSNIGGTDETIAKREDDFVQKLLEDGFVNTKGVRVYPDSAAERACDEIRRVQEYFKSQAGLKISSLSNVAHGVKEDNDDVVDAISLRYRPWANEIGPVCDKVIAMINHEYEPKTPEAIEIIVWAIENYARRLKQSA